MTIWIDLIDLLKWCRPCLPCFKSKPYNYFLPILSYISIDCYSSRQLILYNNKKQWVNDHSVSLEYSIFMNYISVLLLYFYHLLPYHPHPNLPSFNLKSSSSMYCFQSKSILCCHTRSYIRVSHKNYILLFKHVLNRKTSHQKPSKSQSKYHDLKW